MATMSVFPPCPTPGSVVSSSWFQRVVDAIRRYHPVAGRGVMLTETPNGTIINCSATGAAYATAAASTRPFAVRWCSWDDGGESGEWQIYLPFGCVIVDGVTAIPSNAAAKDADGKEIANWYRIEDPADSDARVQIVDGALDKAWAVAVEVKPWPRFEATTTVPFTGENDGRGWLKRLAVASIGVHEEEDGGDGAAARRTVRDVLALVTSAQSFSRDTDSKFALVYRTEGNPYDAGAKFTPFVVNQTVTFGRVECRVEEDTEVEESAERVVLHISHENENISIDVGTEEKESDDDNTYVTLYDLEDGVAVADYRDALSSLTFYTN